MSSEHIFTQTVCVLNKTWLRRHLPYFILEHHKLATLKMSVETTLNVLLFMDAHREKKKHLILHWLPLNMDIISSSSSSNDDDDDDESPMDGGKARREKE